MKPGKPVAFGVRRDHLVFNLPGNPVSVLATFELLVRPAINVLLGLPTPLPAFRPGTLGAAVRRNLERDEFVRATLAGEDGEALLSPVLGQESHMIVRSGRAAALVWIPSGEGELPAGSSVRFLEL
jgi:molybdopterin molybdotransferase